MDPENPIDRDGDGVIEFLDYAEWLASIDVNDPNGLGQSEYDFSYRVFPDDLGNEDNNHYMVININVPVKSGKLGTEAGQSRSAFASTQNILTNEFSKVDQLRFKQNVPGIPQLPGNARNADPFPVPRDTRRIRQSIALHMPNGGLVYTEDNKYEEIGLTSLVTGIFSKAVGLIPNKNLQNFTQTVRDSTGSVIQAGSQIVGYPINPRVEILFANRPQRQWMFEVFLMPRSQKEARTIREIIRTLRFHAAPELDSATRGFTFVPPAEFDITFYRNGLENTNLPRINTCVLERIDMDFSPQGPYATFRDGSPVAVRLSLGFREIEILHKARVFQGF